jgi:hypothetical protein
MDDAFHAVVLEEAKNDLTASHGVKVDGMVLETAFSDLFTKQSASP